MMKEKRRNYRGKRALLISFIVFMAAINLAPRYSEGGCSSPVRRVTFEKAEGRGSLLFGRKDTIQYHDLNAPLQAPVVWRGDNHSRLVLFGKDPSRDSYPPHEALAPADTPQELEQFTQAVEIAWPNAKLDEELEISALFDFKKLFPEGVKAVRSVDIGYCSIPMPWIVDDPAESPAAWSSAARLLGETFDGGKKGFAQVITDQLDEGISESEGVRWHNGVRVNVHTIEHAPDRKQQFWYRPGTEIAEHASGGDEICIQADYLFDYFATFGGVVPISTDCEEIASIRFCGRFDVSPDGALRFSASEVAAEMTGTEGTGTCKAIAREILANIQEQLTDPIEGLIANLNEGLSATSALGIERVEHTPTRLEIIAVDDANRSFSSPIRTILETYGLCRDRENTILEHKAPLITQITDGIEIVK